MRWFDATIPIRDGMVVFPGDPPVRIGAGAPNGDAPLSVSHLEMSAHTGTHIDAPAHVVRGGPGIETIAIDTLIGPAFVADATDVSLHLDAAALTELAIPADCTRLVLKTANSRLWDRSTFSAEFVALTDDGAGWLIDRGVRLVGIDYLSVSPPENPVPVHEALLRAGVVILEGLDLRRVPAGAGTLVCLPLLLPGADGAPARVLIGHDDGAGW
jgi:arylformamidase